MTEPAIIPARVALGVVLDTLAPRVVALTSAGLDDAYAAQKRAERRLKKACAAGALTLIVINPHTGVRHEVSADYFVDRPDCIFGREAFRISFLDDRDPFYLTLRPYDGWGCGFIEADFRSWLASPVSVDDEVCTRTAPVGETTEPIEPLPPAPQSSYGIDLPLTDKAADPPTVDLTNYLPREFPKYVLGVIVEDIEEERRVREEFLPDTATEAAVSTALHLEAALEATPLTARAPSRLKPFWRKAGLEAKQWLGDNGCPEKGDGRQTKLEKVVTDWLTWRGHEASESAIRRHVLEWIDEHQKRLRV